MRAEKANVQEAFLNEARKAEKSIRVLLCNAKELRGKLLAFDNFTLAMEVHGIEMLVYKSAIAAIAPDDNAEKPAARPGRVEV